MNNRPSLNLLSKKTDIEWATPLSGELHTHSIKGLWRERPPGLYNPVSAARVNQVDILPKDREVLYRGERKLRGGAVATIQLCWKHRVLPTGLSWWHRGWQLLPLVLVPPDLCPDEGLSQILTKGKPGKAPLRKGFLGWVAISHISGYLLMQLYLSSNLQA